MFPLAVYIFLGMVSIALFLYMFIDNHNLKYGNIVSGWIAGFIAVYIAVASVSGTVVVDYPVQSFISADGETTVSYDSPRLMQDDGLMWFWYIMAAIETLFSILFSMEAYGEWNKKRILSGKEDPRLG